MSPYKSKSILQARKLCLSFDKWYKDDSEKAVAKLKIELENKRNIFKNSVMSAIQKKYPSICL